MHAYTYTGTQSETGRLTQAGRPTASQPASQPDAQPDNHIYIQSYNHTDRETAIQPGTHTYILTQAATQREAAIQTDIDIHTNIHTYIRT